ncbi:MAG: molybdopterin molybdotransferase MoeA [Deltaproteobacteria bacterium]|nr:molybdopterin molybdotransferase MoeA [Deltaproteobacteria bacterium]
MISASEAHEKILASVRSLSSEKVSLIDALYRYLASSLLAPIDLPVFDHSAMDGYALCHHDTEVASVGHPVSLKIVGTLAAGDPLRTTPLQPGQAIRIMTGAPIPPGADAVIPFEECVMGSSLDMRQVSQESLKPVSCQDLTQMLVVTQPLKPGRHVRKVGEDIVEGELVLSRGTRITSRGIALLSSLGLEHVWVGAKPKTRVIVTGDELVKPGVPLKEGQIYNSNGPSIVAALEEIGITPDEILWVRDNEKQLEDCFKASPGVDVILCMGGVSAGDYDFVPKILAKMGAEILFHKIAIKPGKPLLFARFDQQLIFGLPGNPVSAWVTFDRFVRPALLKMMGAGECMRPRRLARATEVCVGSLGKEDYLRATLQYCDGEYLARPAGPQGSARLKTLADANGVILIPETKDRIGIGESVEVELWEELP